jgi:hypothetical protein
MSIVLFEGSQDSLACPSDKSRMQVKTLEWLEAVAWDKIRWTVIFLINVELHNLEK